MRVRVRFCAGLLVSGALLLPAGTLSAAGSRLIDAIREKDAASVTALLRQRVDVNATQGDGATALHWAVHFDDAKTTDLLIRAGAKVNVANDEGVTPLYLACTNRNAALVERLLSAGADPNAALLNGETMLMNCARTGNPAAVKALLAHGAKVDAKETAHGQTALMWAAAERHPEAVRVLIEAGASVKMRSAIYHENVTSETAGGTGLYRQSLIYTMQKGGSTPLLFAARAGDVESAGLLIAAGADVNETLPNGLTSLVLAAHSNQPAVAIALLDKGADPNSMSAGYSALHAAVLRGEADLVKALLAHHADPNLRITKNSNARRQSQDFSFTSQAIGSTPYMLAAKYLEPGMMRDLVAAGADPKLAMPNGATPLMMAIGNGGGTDAGNDRRGISRLDGGRDEPLSMVVDTVAAALSIDGGPDAVNAIDEGGNTAMHMAAAAGLDPIVQMLADKGANLNVKNKRGRTPLGTLTGGGGGRRSNDPAVTSGVAAADPEPEVRHQSTVDLLRKLGATE